MGFPIGEFFYRLVVGGLRRRYGAPQPNWGLINLPDPAQSALFADSALNSTCGQIPLPELVAALHCYVGPRDHQNDADKCSENERAETIHQLSSCVVAFSPLRLA